MIQLRIAGSETRIPETSWEAWVSEGRIPPDALVYSLALTDGLWRRADSIELYRFFRRTGAEDRREAGLVVSTRSPFAEILEIAFPRHGFSGTEVLLGINFAVAILLLVLWRADYMLHLFGRGDPALSGTGLAWDFYRLFADGRNPIGFVATLFIHASFGHLMANMLSLTAAAAFVEFLYGRRVYLIYLVGGLAGAVLSYYGKGHGPMSVGASGAIFGFFGMVAGFVLRHYGRLPRWHRWRARRIYAPLLVLAVLPSILHADWRAHVGGFVGGLLLAFILRLDPRGAHMLLPRPPRDSGA